MNKFLFDRCFDAPEPAYSAAETTPLPPMVTAEEKDQAVEAAYTEGKEKGWEEGYQAGKQKTQEDILGSISQALEHIRQDVEHIALMQADRLKNMPAEVVLLTRQILQKVFPQMEQQFTLQEAEALIRKILKSEPPSILKIIVHPQLKNPLQEKLKEIDQVTLLFEEDSKMALSQCKAEWNNSGAEWATSQILSEIDELLNGFENVFNNSQNTKNLPIKTPKQKGEAS